MPALNANHTARNLGLLLALVAYILSFFHRVAPSAIASDLQAAFHVGAAQLGNLAATYFYVYTVMQIPTGVLVDTLGPRRVLFGGGLLAGAGSLLFGLAPDFQLAFIGRTLVGLGVSVAFLSLLKLIALGFAENRFASLVGFAVFLGNLGPVVAGRPLSDMAQAVGWRSVFVTVGIASLVAALMSLRWVPSSPRREGSRTAWVGALLQVVRNRHTWPGFAVSTGIAGTFFTFGGLWGIPYLTQALGMSRSLASLHMSIHFIGFALGAAFWGQLSDRVGRRRPVMFAVGCCYVVCWSLLWRGGVSPSALSYGLLFATGACAGCFTLTWSAAKEVNAPAFSGMATGVVNTGCFLGAAILQPAFGFLLELGWDGRMEGGAPWYPVEAYQLPMGVMVLVTVAGTLASLLVKETRCRNIHGALS